MACGKIEHVAGEHCISSSFKLSFRRPWPFILKMVSFLDGLYIVFSVSDHSQGSHINRSSNWWKSSFSGLHCFHDSPSLLSSSSTDDPPAGQRAGRWSGFLSTSFGSTVPKTSRGKWVRCSGKTFLNSRSRTLSFNLGKDYLRDSNDPLVQSVWLESHRWFLVSVISEMLLQVPCFVLGIIGLWNSESLPSHWVGL